MSRFFLDLEEEERRIDRKVASLSRGEEETSKTSKSEKRREELRKRVEEVQGATKHFEKLARKLLAEVGKYSKVFEGGRVPSFVMQFLREDRVSGSTVLRGMAMEFLASYPADRKAVFGDEGTAEDSASVPMSPLSETVDDGKREEWELARIMELISDAEREERLKAFIVESTSEEKVCSALISLFALHSKRGDAKKMLDVFELFAERARLNNSYSDIIRGRLDFYAGKIYDLLDATDYERYERVLGRFADVDPETVQRRLLELRFFRLSLSPETDDPRFRLLSLVQKEDWPSALEYYTRHKELFYPTNDQLVHDTIKESILREFADLALQNCDYGLAFHVYAHCEDRGCAGLRLRLFALCVILGHSVKEHPVFVRFLERFKLLSSNPLILKSENKEDEVMRSFYLMNMLDYVGASRLIKEAVGIPCEDRLKEVVVEMAEERYKIKMPL